MSKEPAKEPMGLLDCNDMVVGHQSFVASMVFGGVVIILRVGAFGLKVRSEEASLQAPQRLRRRILAILDPKSRFVSFAAYSCMLRMSKRRETTTLRIRRFRPGHFGAYIALQSSYTVHTLQRVYLKVHGISYRLGVRNSVREVCAKLGF